MAIQREENSGPLLLWREKIFIVLLLVHKANSCRTYLCSEECMWILHPRLTLFIGHSLLSVRGEDVERIDSTKLGFIVFKSHSHELLISMILCSPPQEICYHWIISGELTIFGEGLKESLNDQLYAVVKVVETWRWPEPGKGRPINPYRLEDLPKARI